MGCKGVKSKFHSSIFKSQIPFLMSNNNIFGVPLSPQEYFGKPEQQEEEHLEKRHNELAKISEEFSVTHCHVVLVSPENFNLDVPPYDA